MRQKSPRADAEASVFHRADNDGSHSRTTAGHQAAAYIPLDPIAVFAPWAGPEDRPLRLRLHRAQAAATARATRSRHGRARVIFWLAADIAGEKTFARTDVADLQDTLAALARLFLVAGWVEHTEAVDDER